MRSVDYDKTLFLVKPENQSDAQSKLDEALVNAVNQRCIGSVKALVLLGANMNLVCARTPAPESYQLKPLLEYVVGFGYLDVLQTLVQANVAFTTDMRHRQGEWDRGDYSNLIDSSIRFGYKDSVYSKLTAEDEEIAGEMTKILISCGLSCELGVPRHRFLDPLMIAVRRGMVDTVQRILATGVNANRVNISEQRRDDSYLSPLKLAICDSEMIKLLCDGGADPWDNVPYQDGTNSRHLSRELKYYEEYLNFYTVASLAKTSNFYNIALRRGVLIYRDWLDIYVMSRWSHPIDPSVVEALICAGAEPSAWLKLKHPSIVVSEMKAQTKSAYYERRALTVKQLSSLLAAKNLSEPLMNVINSKFANKHCPENLRNRHKVAEQIVKLRQYLSSPLLCAYMKPLEIIQFCLQQDKHLFSVWLKKFEAPCLDSSTGYINMWCKPKLKDTLHYTNEQGQMLYQLLAKLSVTEPELMRDIVIVRFYAGCVRQHGIFSTPAQSSRLKSANNNDNLTISDSYQLTVVKRQLSSPTGVN